MTLRRGRAAVTLPDTYETALRTYVAQLADATLAPTTCAKYVTRVHEYLTWLSETAPRRGAAPLREPKLRDRATRAYLDALRRRHQPGTIITTRAALADFYDRSGAGAPQIPGKAPRTRPPLPLTAEEATAYVTAAAACPLVRDRAIALLPLRAGLSTGEVVATDVADLRRNAETLRVKGREVTLDPLLTAHLRAWLDERAGSAGRSEVVGADARAAPPPEAALFLNQRGERISERTVRSIVAGVGRAAGLTVGSGSPRRLRHTYVYSLPTPAPAVTSDGTDAAGSSWYE